MSPGREGQIAAIDVDPEAVRMALRDFVNQLANAERERVGKILHIYGPWLGQGYVCLLSLQWPGFNSQYRHVVSSRSQYQKTPTLAPARKGL